VGHDPRPRIARGAGQGETVDGQSVCPARAPFKFKWATFVSLAGAFAVRSATVTMTPP
jgi:hypothetical protein